MLLQLKGIDQSYDWGSTFRIQEFLGRPKTGSKIAEVWFGAHHSAPSGTPFGPLDRYLQESKILANGNAQNLDAPILPYLVKFLAADKPLSIQVHPNRQQAIRGYEREERTGVPIFASERSYKDKNSKPEVLVALSRFRAVGGFQEIVKIRELLSEFDIKFTHDLTSILNSDRPVSTKLNQCVDYIFDLDDKTVRTVAMDLIEDLKQSSLADQFNRQLLLSNLLDFSGHFPGDPGGLVTILMHHIQIEPGEAIFLPACQLHAYVSGLGLEVMGNSDNVLRAGLTSKYVDKSELLSILDFCEISSPVLDRARVKSGIRTDSFSLELLNINSVHNVQVPAGSMIVLTSGNLETNNARFGQGDCIFITDEHPRLSIEGDCEFAIVRPRFHN